MKNEGSETRLLPVLLGASVGALGFLPIFLSMRLSRRSASLAALTIGLYGLVGVFVSLVVLIVGLLACAFIARDLLVAFVAAEGIVFLGATIAYVVYKNVLAKRRARREA